MVYDLLRAEPLGIYFSEINCNLSLSISINYCSINYYSAEAQNNLPPNQPPVNPAHHLPYAPDEGAAVYFR